MLVEVSIEIPAPRSVVWAEVSELSRHVEWMADAESIRFTTDVTEGVGTVMEVATRIGPLRTNDIMEITEWVVGERISVDHRGLVSGSGTFELADLPGGGTRFAWSETLRFPRRFGGSVGAWMAAPIFRWIWRRNLARLGERVGRPPG